MTHHWKNAIQSFHKDVSSCRFSLHNLFGRNHNFLLCYTPEMSFQHLKHRHFQKWSSSLMPGISRLIRSSYLPINSWKPAKKTCFFRWKNLLTLGIPACFSQVRQVRVTTRLPSPSSWHQRPALSGAAGELFVPPEHGEWEQIGTDGNRWEQSTFAGIHQEIWDELTLLDLLVVISEIRTWEFNSKKSVFQMLDG